MQRYHKVMAFFAYLSGIIALLAILVDDKKNKLYSFHIWQAFLLNIVIAAAAIVVYVWWLPHYILTVDIYQRATFFANITIFPIFVVMLLLIILGVFAAEEKKFYIPLICCLASKISHLEE